MRARRGATVGILLGLAAAGGLGWLGWTKLLPLYRSPGAASAFPRGSYTPGGKGAYQPVDEL